jgi:hypothetical protein
VQKMCSRGCMVMGQCRNMVFKVIAPSLESPTYV